MNNIFEKLKTLYSKYKSLKQYPFTHIIILGTYSTFILLLFSIINSIYTSNYVYLLFAIQILPYTFVAILIISLIVGIIQIFTKTQIKDSYLLQNKLYNKFWHIGNILLILLLLIYKIFKLIIFKS